MAPSAHVAGKWSPASRTTRTQRRSWAVFAFLLADVGILASVFAANAVVQAFDWSRVLGYRMGGIIISLLLGALIYLLGTGRARTRSLVEQRTDELQFHALHDSLTALPNRALIMDRIDQLLARGRRNGTAGAALCIDLDDFKNVNDSLGHEAGDQLLQAVALRLASTLRGADTIGRMGGDEFVVLIDGSDPHVLPELVAERLLAVMKKPFELDQFSRSLQITTSIGIAVGDRPSNRRIAPRRRYRPLSGEGGGEKPIRILPS